MRARFRYSLICSLLLVLLSCNLPSEAITETPPVLVTVAIATDTQKAPTLPTSTSTASVPTATPKAPTAYFTTAVIVDTTSESVTRVQAQNLVNDASKILLQHTPFGIQMVDFTEDASGDDMETIARRYIAAHTSDTPNSLMIFSFGDDDIAKLYGGYAFATRGPAGFRNPFESIIEGNTEVYIGVVHFSHKYAACGYAGQDTVQNTVSSNGECRGVDGVACVEYNGYSMCSDAVENLYASTPTYFSASTIVHEILHSFGPNGIEDHYATDACDAAMRWETGHFDLAESQQFAGMCPFVFDNFTESYKP